ncbi:hypothetical protein HanRHA438_Chr09g0429101 [Helianthus annuus]|nr:hypothetical protein HanIR_Chr09g0449341 [Helianthus annuus]KAJ0890916.1 hypothetical protein HanRHA438_Chr09g0429101 [Helianthus annuus]
MFKVVGFRGFKPIIFMELLVSVLVSADEGKKLVKIFSCLSDICVV